MPTSTLARALTLLLLFLGWGVPRAHTAENDLGVEQLYDRAKTHLQSRQYDQALDACWRGLEVPDLPDERRWGFLSGAAMAYEGLQQPIHSLEMYHRLLQEIGVRGDDAPQVWRKRRAQMGEFVRRFEAEVLAAHGSLAVDSSPTGARLTVDDRPYGPDGASRAPTTLYLGPGEHRVRFELPDCAPVEITVVIRAGLRDQAIADLSPQAAPEPEPAQVAVVVSPPPIAPPPEAEASTAAPTPVVTRPATRAPLAPLWGWVLLGSGGALALTGVPFTVLAFSDGDALARASKGTSVADLERYDSLKSSVKTKQTVAGVLYGLGGAALAGGAAWLIVAHVLDSDGAAAPTVGFLPTSGGFTLTIGGPL